MAEGISEVERLAKELSPADQMELVERLVRDLRLRETRTPVDLYGAWRGRFPADFDVDRALDEIRFDWKRENQP